MHLRTEKLQATSIKVMFGDKMGKQPYLQYTYHRNTVTESDFNLYFATLGSRFISGGDWNAKHTYWSSRLINPRGRQLYKPIQRLGLHCMTTRKPTYCPTNSNRIPDLLDFFIFRNINQNYMTVEECTDLTSDHTPVVLNVNATVVLTSPPARLYNNYTDWELYQDIITSEFNLMGALNTTDDIEEAI